MGIGEPVFLNIHGVESPSRVRHWYYNIIFFFWSGGESCCDWRPDRHQGSLPTEAGKTVRHARQGSHVHIEVDVLQPPINRMDGVGTPLAYLEIKQASS